MANTNASDASNRTLSIRKTFALPLARVWDAWTNPEQIVQWWAPPGMPVQVIEHDFRVGGNWKFSSPMPNGESFISEGTYLEIVEHRSIKTSANFRPMTENVILDVSFEEQGDTTLFCFSVIHESEEYAQAQEKMGFYNGWGSALSRMEALATRNTQS